MNRFTHIRLILLHIRESSSTEVEKKKRKKTMKANEKFNKCVRSYITQTWSSTLYCHLKSTLKFHTNQPISGLIEQNTLSPNFKIHNFAFEQNGFLLLPRKCTGPSLLEVLIYATLCCVPDSRETPEKRNFKDRP